MTEGTEGMFDLENRHPLSMFPDIFKAIEEFAEDGVSWEDFVEGTKAWDHALKASGALTGIPAQTIINEMRGLGELVRSRGRSDEVKSGAAKAMGYSSYTVDEKILAP